MTLSSSQAEAEVAGGDAPAHAGSQAQTFAQYQVWIRRDQHHRDAALDRPASAVVDPARGCALCAVRGRQRPASSQPRRAPTDADGLRARPATPAARATSRLRTEMLPARFVRRMQRDQKSAAQPAVHAATRAERQSTAPRDGTVRDGAQGDRIRSIFGGLFGAQGAKGAGDVTPPRDAAANKAHGFGTRPRQLVAEQQRRLDARQRASDRFWAKAPAFA
jgi:hypothetical protein